MSHHVRWSPPDDENKILGDILLSIDSNILKKFPGKITIFSGISSFYHFLFAFKDLFSFTTIIETKLFNPNHTFL